MSNLSNRISHLSSVQLAFAAQQIEAKSELMRAEPIAIIGMACRFPGGADDPDAFWHLLKRGGDAIREVPRDRWDIEAFYDPNPNAPGKMCCRFGGFLERVDLFDADFFGISPREATSMDPQQRLLLEVSWQALEHANQPMEQLFGSRTGVFVGISTFDYAALRAGLRDRSAIDGYHVSGVNLSVAAGRLSYLLGLHGPCMSVDTACSSSLVSIHLACQSLRNRESSLALAAGVGLILVPEPSITFSKAGMLARDGRCKTFDAAADGYVRGEGCGVVVLKRLADALSDGDRVLAVVRGSAVNQDGSSGGLTVPSGPSQEAVIRQALAGAGLDPLQVSYVEAHGTGTSLGDPIELNALAAALCQERSHLQPLMVGSVKTNIGHLEAASGIAGVIKVVLALRHQEIPAQLHFKTPNPHLNWKTMPIDVVKQGRPWLPISGRRIAGVSAFGFSGTNAHIVLEEAPEEISPKNNEEKPLHLLMLSAKSEATLNRLIDRYLHHMDILAEQEIGNLCYTASTGRSQFSHRLAIIAATKAELKDKLVSAKTIDKAQRSLRSSLGIWQSENTGYSRKRHPFHFDFNHRTNDLQSDLEGLARSFADGAQIDWDNYYADHSYLKISLPTYPFQGERFWAETVADPGKTGTHFGLPPSLPGKRLHLPMSRDIRFETTLGGTLPTFLADHQLFGVVVVAGATYFAMLVKAAQEAFHQEAVVLAEVLLEQALTVGQGDTTLVQTVIAPETEGLFAFQVMSSGAEAADEQAWQRHVSGKMRIPEEMLNIPPNEVLAKREVARAMWEKIDAVGLYAEISRAGHQLGDSFRWVRTIWKQGKEALCLLRTPDASASWDEFALYPGLIDSCFQFFCIWGQRLWTAGSDDPDILGLPDQHTTYVPFFLEEMQFFGQKSGSTEPRRQLWCHATVRTVNPLTKGMTGDIVLFDQDGHMLVKFNGLNVRKLNRDQLVQQAPPLPQKSGVDGLHRVDWLPIRRPEISSDITAPSQWLIFSDQGGMGETLGRLLRLAGDSVILIFPGSEYGINPAAHYRINPDVPADFVRLAADCYDDSCPCKGIIHLWSLDTGEETLTGALDNARTLTWGSVLNLVQAFADRPRFGQPRLWLVTRGALTVSSPELNLNPFQSLLWGLASTIRLEQPQWKCTCIDLSPSDTEDQTPFLLKSIRCSDTQDRIAIRGHSFYGARIVPLRLPQEGDWFVQPDATYLITGGLGALGLASASWLVERGATHLVLAGRGSGSAAAREQIGKLENAGARVKTVAADVSRRSEVSRIFEALGGMPPLKGIIHAAGVLADAVLAKQDTAQFNQVLLPKAQGAWNLHQATQGQPLDFFICYSSAASVLGSAGQSNYAAANAFLDALVHFRRSQGMHGLSVNWGPWELGMAAGMENRDSERIAAQGFKAISPAQGFRILERLLFQDETQASVLQVNWDTYLRYQYRGAVPPFFEAMSVGSTANRSMAEEKSELLAKLEAASAAELRVILADYIQTQVAAVLEEPMSNRIKPRQRLFDLGIDSLMAVELKNRLQSGLHLPLEATLVFDYPTVEALVDHLLTQMIFSNKSVRSLEQKTAVSPMANELEDVSQDEIAQMLAMELKLGKEN